MNVVTVCDPFAVAVFDMTMVEDVTLKITVPDWMPVPSKGIPAPRPAVLPTEVMVLLPDVSDAVCARVTAAR